MAPGLNRPSLPEKSRNFLPDPVFVPPSTPPTEMEPFDPNDPLSKLLARARPVEPRGNFTQNVLREARQTPQDRGWWVVARAWMLGSASSVPALRIAAACAAVAVAALAWWGQQPGLNDQPAIAVTVSPAEPAPAGVAGIPSTAQEFALPEEIPLVPTVETQWQNLDHLDALLAVEDTSMLSDSEVAFFLY